MWQVGEESKYHSSVTRAARLPSILLQCCSHSSPTVLGRSIRLGRQRSRGGRAMENKITVLDSIGRTVVFVSFRPEY